MKTLTVLIALLGFGLVSNAQTLTTAETLGKGNIAGFVASSALTQDLSATYSYGQILYGLTSRLDLYGGAGVTTATGQAQASVTGGANINLIKSKFVSLSAFNLISTPINRRRDASSALWFIALVASKNFQVRKSTWTAYSGYSVNVPLGHTQDKLFTPTAPVHNIPLGLCIPHGRLAFFAEYNFGKQAQMLAGGVSFTIKGGT